jgi:hypothetical protein
MQTEVVCVIAQRASTASERGRIRQRLRLLKGVPQNLQRGVGTCLEFQPVSVSYLRQGRRCRGKHRHQGTQMRNVARRSYPAKTERRFELLTARGVRPRQARNEGQNHPLFGKKIGGQSRTDMANKRESNR